ncbi:MAG: hypothetical protein J6T95_00620 [Oscillospiraceae bacterium]|nr:hypothetical protein [Oscillospiraceae bacterium]
MNEINKKQFLAELGRLLTFMSEEDRKTALGIYGDMFDDAPDEQALTGFLISPTRQAVYMARAYNKKPESAFDPMKEYGEEPEEPEDERPGYIKALDHARAEAEKDGIVSPYSFAEPESEEPLEETEPEELQEVDDFLLSKDTESEETEETEKPEEAEEPVKNVETVEDEENDDDEPIETGKTEITQVSKGKTVKKRPLLLLLFLLIFIPLGLLGIVCLIGFAAVALACGAAACALGIFGVRAALTGFPIVADIIIILGAALISLALGLLFFWIFIWLLFSVIPGLIKEIAGLGKRWYLKEVDA